MADSFRNQISRFPLGMSRTSLCLTEHQASWAAAFLRAEKELATGVPCALKLHHVGSTSIPGIRAKPILDLLGEVDSLAEFDLQQTKLESLGFTWKGEYGIPGRRYCVLYDESAEKGLVHLHVFEKGHREVGSHLLFRDYLRAEPKAARRYEELKLSLAEKFASSRSRYTEGKADLIAELLEEARSWAGGSG